ncbi:uncharacterized protein LOC135367891 [Ornithodoros turicata]|uniref:uncharacterized protein LOC135367891 n=1 Tax=Ornithodoros turicata TaxID=34597 RepID=UPI003138ED28
MTSMLEQGKRRAAKDSGVNIRQKSSTSLFQYAASAPPENQDSPSPRYGRTSPTQSPKSVPFPRTVKKPPSDTAKDSRLPQHEKRARSPHAQKGSPSPRLSGKHTSRSPKDSPSPFRFKDAGTPSPQLFSGSASPAPGTPRATTPESASKLESNVPRPTSRRYRTCVVVAVVSCILLSIPLYALIARSLASSEVEVCNTSSCHAYAGIVMMTLNYSLDPCKNFYRHVCDGWSRRRKAPPRRAQVDTYIDLVRKSASGQEIPAPTSGQSGDQKAVAFYKSCTNVVQGAKDELPEVKKILARVNLTWPHISTSANIIEAIFYINHKLDISLLLDVEVRANSTHEIVALSAPSYLLQVMKRIDELTASDEYENFFTDLSKHFAAPGKPIVTFTEQIELQTLFFQAFRNILVRSSDSATKRHYSIEGLATITTWSGYSEQRWMTAFREQLGILGNKAINIEFTESGHKILMAILFHKVGQSKVQFMAGYLLAIRVSAFANFDLLENLYRDKWDRREAVAEENSKFCFGVTMKYMATGFLYSHFRTWPTAAQRRDISEIASNVERTFKTGHRLATNVSLVASVTKFADIHRALDVNKTYEHFETMGSKFMINLQAAVRAYRTSPGEYIRISDMDLFGNDVVLYRMNTATNDLYFYPYAFVQPLYDVDGPLVSKYAGIGSELSLAYANLVLRNKVAEGNVSCMMRANPRVKDQAQLEDLYIRTVALDISLKSWKTAGASAKERRLSVPRLTNDQLFFVFRCYHLCSNVMKWEQACNVPLRTRPTFSTTFGCPDRTFMKAVEACQAQQY